MAFPSTIDSFTNPAGTSLLTSPDHALQHTNANNAIVNIENTVGTTLGTNVLKAFAAGDIPARITTANVLKQSITGTVGISAGSITGQITNTGTLANGVYGTALHQGGTVNSAVVGSPTITGGNWATGTVTNIVSNTGTYGTINAPASKDLILSAGSAVLITTTRQGGDATSFSVAGTTSFVESNLFVQFGMVAQTNTGTPAAGGTVIFPVAFSQVPWVSLSNIVGAANPLIPGINSIAAGSFTFNDERTAGTISWIAIGKR